MLPNVGRTIAGTGCPGLYKLGNVNGGPECMHSLAAACSLLWKLCDQCPQAPVIVTPPS